MHRTITGSMRSHYRINKQRDMSRVTNGTEWQFVFPLTTPRFMALAIMRNGRLVIKQAVDLCAGIQIEGAIGSEYDIPSRACRAVDPASEYNGWVQWRWRGNDRVTLDDVERGKVLLAAE